jgi:hypothetical protein
MGMRAVFLVAMLLMMGLLPFQIPEPLAMDEAVSVNPTSHGASATVSPANGWTTGGEDITIKGSGFLDMAFKNVTNDGEPYTWTTNTINYVTGAGYSPSVVVDSNGTVHIVHVIWSDDELWHSKLTVGSTTWSHTKIMDCNGCRETDMTIDSHDNLHLAFYLKQEGTTGYLYYGVYDGSVWSTQSLQNNVYNNQIRIVLDAHDRPHISYAKAGYICNGAMLKYHDGTNWVTQTIDTTTTYVGCDSSIAIDQNGHVHVTYRHHSNRDQMIGSNISGTWQRYTVDGGSGVGYDSDMVVDHDNNLQMLYRTDAAGGQYKHATGLSGSAWSNTPSSGGYNGFRMQTDALGNLHASMYDSGSDDLVYGMLVPSSGNPWTFTSVDTAGDVGYENDMFVDDNNMIHIAYYDSTNQRLKYANKSSGMYLKQEITVDFGAYGQVTGTVVNDTTIVVTTPPAGSVAETVNLSLWGEDGTEHPLGVSFLFISPDDVDMDGVLNVDDDCPNTAGDSTIDRDGCPDGDGDGYSDENDAFPTNPSEWFDTDFDGVGDNSDVFPNDTSEWMDSDGDGVGDNGDAFPYDANETMDSDNDGYGDNADMFPFNAFEHLDSDADGAGDNSDAFPFDASETMDSDGDGVGDNADAFPNDASETMDSDGDGIGDNSDSHPFINNFLDSDGDEIPDLQDAFPADLTQWVDSDGDGYGDNATGTNPDAFTNLASQWSDIDGDGYGDNWGNGSWNETRAASGVGQYVEGAVMADYCPQVLGNSTASGYFGCVDDDGDGIPNMFEQEEVIVDADGDGVLDEDDECPGTPVGTEVDSLGCAVTVQNEDEVVASEEDFFSSELGQAVGWGALLLAVFTFLQTNMAASVLPDAVKWVQVFRNNSKLSKEEENELTYLQSLVQAYFQEPETLAEELRGFKADLTARFTNNEIKAETREKIGVLINDLLASSHEDLVHIAHNDAYFGLVATVNAAERTELLREKLAMTDDGGDDVFSEPAPPKEANGRINPEDGYEWLEYPEGSGVNYHRAQKSGEWTKWQG